MLIRFVTANFLSFHEEKEFNMLAGSYRTHRHHVYKAGRLNVLKGAAIYGANGAGKSNLVKAIDFFQNLVKKGSLERSIISKKFKLHKLSLQQPTEFEIEFFYKRKIYAYGLRINGHLIEQEWLYISGVNSADKLIFERETQKDAKTKIKLAKKYLKTQKDRLLVELMEENLLKSNELFLGKSDSLKMTDIQNVRKWINKNLIIIYPQSKFKELVPFMASSSKAVDFANQLLSTFDTGVQGLQVEHIDFDIYFGKEDDATKKELIEEIESGDSVIFTSEGESVLATKENGKNIVKRVMAIHKDSDDDAIHFNLTEESDGTQRLLDFIPTFEGILNANTTFIIDEIDQSLHPALLYSLVKKIMGETSTNGQLIFTTHESNLLDLNIFRQDEIWFVEKNNAGATELYALSDFNPRYDLDIQKGYLKGRFGAIPFTSDLKSINWTKDDA